MAGAISTWAALVAMLRSVLSLAVAVVSTVRIAVAVMLAALVAHSTLAGTHVVVVFRVLAALAASLKVV